MGIDIPHNRSLECHHSFVRIFSFPVFDKTNHLDYFRCYKCQALAYELYTYYNLKVRDHISHEKCLHKVTTGQALIPLVSNIEVLWNKVGDSK